MSKNKAKTWLRPLWRICNQTAILIFEFLSRKSPLIYEKRAKELICYTCSYLSRLLDRFNEHIKGFSIDNKRVKKILVIRLDKIGDMVWTSPVFVNLRNHFPSANISVVAGSWTVPIIESNPYIDNVIKYDVWCYAPQGKKCTLFRDRLKILRQLSKEQFDLILNLRTSIGFLFFGLLSSGVFIGKETREHGVRSSLSPLYKLGLKSLKEELSLFLPNSARIFAEEFLKNNGITNGDVLIAIHPGAGWVGRQWRPENFAVVADELTKKYESNIVIFGSPDDIHLAQEIASKMKSKPIIAAGKTNLMQMSGILRKCKLFIGHDTGPMHIAVALKVPVVVLRGAADISDAHPWTSKDMYRIVSKDVSCWPCDEIICDNGYKCVQSITVDEVLSASFSIMESK